MKDIITEGGEDFRNSAGHVVTMDDSTTTMVICGDINIDESFEFYGLLKNKKMVNGIPVILCYKKGNETFIPDDSVTGADPAALDAFFKRCGANLIDVKKRFPPREKDRNIPKIN